MLSPSRIGTGPRSETEQFSAQLGSPDAKEAFTAFLEKRPADFTGRKTAIPRVERSEASAAGSKP